METEHGNKTKESKKGKEMIGELQAFSMGEELILSVGDTTFLIKKPTIRQLNFTMEQRNVGFTPFYTSTGFVVPGPRLPDYYRIELEINTVGLQTVEDFDLDTFKKKLITPATITTYIQKP